MVVIKNKYMILIISLTVILLFFSIKFFIKERITLIADPEVIAIKIVENYDPMIELREQDILSFGPSPEIPNNQDYTKLRKPIYDKLVEAQKLLPNRWKLRVYEGYRSIELQEQLFNMHYAELKKLHPKWNHKELFVESTKLVSPVINLDGSVNVPPHATGGAVDVYLIDENGELVDMGMRVEEVDNDLDGSLSLTKSRKISKEAERNRAIMGEVLTKVGFVNYPTEYWHWSYGDRYWAYMKKKPRAFYGMASGIKERERKDWEVKGVEIQLLKENKDLLPQLVDIWHEVLGKIWAPNQSKFRVRGVFNWHLNDDSLPLTLVAFYEGEPVGMVSLRQNDGLGDELTPWLGSLVVDKNHQKKGIGKMLIESVKQKAKDMGFKKLYLYSFDPKLNNYYESMGWHKVGESEMNGHTVNIMQIDL